MILHSNHIHKSAFLSSTNDIVLFNQVNECSFPLRKFSKTISDLVTSTIETDFDTRHTFHKLTGSS